MKAPLALSSVIEKTVAILAFLPLLFMVYPEFAAAANTAQTDRTTALVFEVNSKQKTNKQTATAEVIEEENPTLSNPCYPAPLDSCNPDASAAQQPEVIALAASVTKANLGSGKTYSKDEVQQLIIQYSAEYKIDPQTPLCIARLESGYNQFSKNRRSTASGVFQYLNGTWKATDEGKAGLSVFDAEANVKAGVKYMAIHKSTKPWVVGPKCPKIAFVK